MLLLFVVDGVVEVISLVLFVFDSFFTLSTDFTAAVVVVAVVLVLLVSIWLLLTLVRVAVDVMVAKSAWRRASITSGITASMSESGSPMRSVPSCL